MNDIVQLFLGIRNRSTRIWHWLGISHHLDSHELLSRYRTDCLVELNDSISRYLRALFLNHIRELHSIQLVKHSVMVWYVKLLYHIWVLNMTICWSSIKYSGPYPFYIYMLKPFLYLWCHLCLLAIQPWCKARLDYLWCTEVSRWLLSNYLNEKRIWRKCAATCSS